uniref:DUF1738 domain-containing protein n=1 Tax=Caenorhabditis tropicalis TaxID=1561998 RepID=A0A1I7TLC9_9PELO
MKPTGIPGQGDHVANPAPVELALSDVWNYFNVVQQQDDLKWRTVNEIVRMFIKEKLFTGKQLKEALNWTHIVNFANNKAILFRNKSGSEQRSKSGTPDVVVPTGIPLKHGLTSGSPILPKTSSLTGIPSSANSFVKQQDLPSNSGLPTHATNASKNCPICNLSCSENVKKVSGQAFSTPKTPSTPATFGVSERKITKMSSGDLPIPPIKESIGSTSNILQSQQQVLSSSNWKDLSKFLTTAMEQVFIQKLPSLDNHTLCDIFSKFILFIREKKNQVLDEDPFRPETLVLQNPEIWKTVFGLARRLVAEKEATTLTEAFIPKEGTEEINPEAKRTRKRTCVDSVSEDLKKKDKKDI